MGQYTIWTLGNNNRPKETFPYSCDDLQTLQEYLKGYRANNPGKAYWLCDRQTGEMLPY